MVSNFSQRHHTTEESQTAKKNDPLSNQDKPLDEPDRGERERNTS